MFNGTWLLIRLMLRQQRFKFFVWLTGLVGVTLAAASAYPSMYPDSQAKQAFAITMKNPAMIAMVGPGYEKDAYSAIGALFANEMLLFTAITAAIMNILLVTRMTRGDEEDGRTEMIRSLPAGRLAYICASGIIIVSLNVMLAVITGAGLMSLGIDSLDAESSFLYGSILAGTGLVFAGFTAVFAQVAETSRGTSILAFGTLIIAYLLRAFGDVKSDVLSLISPLGWTVRTNVFVNNHWWPVYLFLLLTIGLIAVAFWLQSIRDLNAGFIPAKNGRVHASPFLLKPFGLILRLQQTNLLIWGISLFSLSAAFGFILGDLENYFSDVAFIESMLKDTPGGNLTDQFISLLMAIMALISTVPSIMAVMHVKGEETKHRTENIYSRAISRTHLLSSYLILAIAVSYIMQALVALGLWAASLGVMADPLTLQTIFSAAFVYLPAIWLITGIGVLLIGLLPTLTPFVWAFVFYGFVTVYIGSLLDLPNWLNNLSVFEHIPQLPAAEMDVTPISWITGIAIAAMVTGIIGYQKRDLKG
ncbi:ABC-2 type transport system permease protein [Lentibacillus persicus]|uniref:ABC-2 type transport system permease protein n=1 Tax=Lentibacillus persicus TaxID=640948 RepID=A0A1I1S318_9BACI|nr:ABC transporter permease [Lentibacillus persicus]SFD40925.1 ABC-2 type transport system permease protein [Lentibacillus persicus]